MKLFGRKSVGRALARPALARAFSWGGSDIPQSYEQRVRSGYRDNPVAQRAVRLVAESIGSAPLSISDPAVLALVQATSAGQGLLETAAAHVLLHGNAFIQILCDPFGKPVELFALRPERITIVGDARGWPLAYIYKVGDAAMRLSPDTIIHIKAMNPLDDHYGLGCLGAATNAVAIHNAATQWNKALLDNAARPSGALVYDPGEAGATLSADQFDRLRAEMEASFAGAGNAGRPMLLEGGLRWQALSFSPTDMDFIALKSVAAREIALAFGVPPVLLGLPGDATYSNYREANRALWRQTILPLCVKILGAIAQGLAETFPGVSLSVNLDQVTELAEDRERLWMQVNAADFLTLDEKRAMVGLETVSLPIIKAGEVKYNDNHDPANGQFTSDGNGGARLVSDDRFRGGGGSFGGGGATGGGYPSPSRTKPKLPKTVVASPTIITSSRGPGNKPLTIAKAPATPRGRSLANGFKRISRNGYDFNIDSLQRTRRAGGTMVLNPSQPISRASQRNAGGVDRRATDDGGHFIGREFSGPRGAFNHFAQDRNFNRSGYRKLELGWKKAIRSGKTVTVDIVPAYKGTSLRPSSVYVVDVINGVRNKMNFPNEPKGN